MHFTIEDRVNNFKKFYARKNTRPLLGFFLGSEYPLHRYDTYKNLPEHRPLKVSDFNVEGFCEDCERLFQENENCGGDFTWSGSAFWGIPWLEASLGCSIIANHSTGSIHSERPENFASSSDIPDFDEKSPWSLKLVEYLNAMKAVSNNKWPIGTTRMRGIADLLSALYGSDKFIYAMIEQPDEIIKLCEKLCNFWIEFAKLQLKHIPLFHGGVGSFYYNMWAPAGTVMHQEDAAALMSPQLYEQFIKPYDLRIVESFPGCIIHQHPTGYVPTDHYLQMNFLALELHIDEGGPSAQQLYKKHCDILAKKPLLIWGNLSNDDLEWIFSKLPSQGLAVMTVVDNAEAAKNIWHKFMEKR